MKVEIEIWEKVWERTTAVVDVDEKAAAEYIEMYEKPELGIEDYLMENMADWYDTAYHAYEHTVNDDSDVTVTILKGAE